MIKLGCSESLPKNWSWVEADEIMDVRDGTHDSPKAVANGIPLVTSKNLVGGQIDFSTCNFISQEDHVAIARRSAVENGDILYAMIGTIGNPVIVKKDFEFSIKNVALFKFDKSEEVHNRFIFHFLNSNLATRQFNSNSRGGTQKFVSLGNIRGLQIPLPPLDEQKRIAAILDKADAIRRKRQQAIQLADDFLKSVFLDMFGQTLKKATGKVRFGDVAKLDAKMVDPREEDFLDLLHIGPDRIEKHTGKLLPAKTAREEGLISKKFLFDSRYVLYSKIRPYLRKAALPDFTALCSADMYPIKPMQGVVTREFIWSLLLSNFFDNYVSSLPARANIPKMNRTELSNFEFSLPEYEKVEEYSKIVRATFERDKKTLKSLQFTNNLFASLSQKVFAGEL
ncbi:restriction endonuclease subunit S [Alteromonas sp. P256]|uniref:restriction endonuclease subunit S n=1 Tax=Alteromonas sp. P256 TaxID=3117399 RepID=UPI002FE178B4